MCGSVVASPDDGYCDWNINGNIVVCTVYVRRTCLCIAGGTARLRSVRRSRIKIHRLHTRWWWRCCWCCCRCWARAASRASMSLCRCAGAHVDCRKRWFRYARKSNMQSRKKWSEYYGYERERSTRNDCRIGMHTTECWICDQASRLKWNKMHTVARMERISWA